MPLIFRGPNKWWLVVESVPGWDFAQIVNPFGYDEKYPWSQIVKVPYVTGSQSFLQLPLGTLSTDLRVGPLGGHLRYVSQAGKVETARLPNIFIDGCV